MIDMRQLAAIFSPSEGDGRFFGVTVGVVTNNQDPDNLGRVKVKFPWLSDEDESHWARVLTPMAGNDRGLYFLPEVDDEVLVAFEHGRAEFPYVLGALWNGKDKAPESNDDGKNNMRTLKSRSGHIIRLDDTDGSEKIEILDKSGKNSVVISTADNTITVAADADITVQSGSGKLILSGNGIEIKSQTDVKIEASANMDLEAGGQMNVKGSMVNIN
jgi:uncharacterized protein involved in type VI secretion and phage assembly